MLPCYTPLSLPPCIRYGHVAAAATLIARFPSFGAELDAFGTSGTAWVRAHRDGYRQDSSMGSHRGCRDHDHGCGGGDGGERSGGGSGGGIEDSDGDNDGDSGGWPTDELALPGWDRGWAAQGAKSGGGGTNDGSGAVGAGLHDPGSEVEERGSGVGGGVGGGGSWRRQHAARCDLPELDGFAAMADGGAALVRLFLVRAIGSQAVRGLACGAWHARIRGGVLSAECALLCVALRCSALLCIAAQASSGSASTFFHSFYGVLLTHISLRRRARFL